MGFVRNTFGIDLTGNEAVRQGARAQKEAGTEAIEFQQQALDQLRADLSPFTQAGAQALPQLQSLLDPQAQADFVTNNPLFQQLAQDTSQRVFANQAARGKLGAGETASILGQQLLPIGQQMAQQQFSNLFNVGQLGQASAAQQGAAGVNTAQNIGGVLQGLGNVQAASLGQQQANTANLINQGLQTGASLFMMSDRRMKRDIKEVGKLDNGLAVYTYKYLDDERVHMGVMAQELEEVNPEAVTEHDGIKYVNYGAI